MAGPSTTSPEGALLGDRYALRERIGLGGMASVWLAEDVRLGREVAVKVLSEALAEDEAFVARFRREARVAAALAHPNLVGVFDFDPDGDQPYLVMEYVPGPNLAQRIERGDVIEAERVAADLLAALDSIHRAGVVHRDVKPANVLLAPGGRAMLTDFGIARPEDATSITQTGQMPGTGRYMAPELMDGEPASPRSDLYSCGVLMQEILTRETSPAYCDLADRLAHPDPQRRPPSARAALAELPLSPARAAKPSFVPEPAPAPDARPPGAGLPTRPAGPTRHGAGGWDRSRLAAAGAVAAVLLGVGLLIATSDNDGTPLRTGRQAAGAGQAAEDGKDGAGEQGERVSRGGATRGVPEPAAQPDPAEAQRLNDEGFALANAGRPGQAIPLLERSVSLFGENTSDLNYAYALFNLGHALREAGRPQDAVPVLRERLEIPNQTDVVREELQAALAEAD